MLDTLLTTLMREIQDTVTPGRSEEATMVARRFVRSVARIFVVFSIMTPQTRKRRGYVSLNENKSTNQLLYELTMLMMI